MNKKKRFNQIVKDIKEIKIQGARNIAKKALYAYSLIPTRTSKKKLLSSRPTEPMMENILDMGNVKITSDLDRYIQSWKALFEGLRPGFGWEKKPVYIDELSKLYNEAKVVLNFTRGNIGFSDRVFHVLGTKSFLISEYCNDLKKFFKKGFHLDWFKTTEQLKNLIQFYLKNKDLREKIAKNGYKLLINNFTWEKVAEKILNIIRNQIQ